MFVIEPVKSLLSMLCTLCLPWDLGFWLLTGHCIMFGHREDLRIVVQKIKDRTELNLYDLSKCSVMKYIKKCQSKWFCIQIVLLHFSEH